MLTSPNAPKTYHVSEPLPWLPQELSGGFTYTTCFSRPERQVYRRRQKLWPSVWVEKHRWITQGRLAGSVMRLDNSPHIATQLDVADCPSVRCVVVCAAPQTAKSTMVDSYIAYRMDMAPGPALTVYPDQRTGEKNMVKRIHKMIDLSPRLRSLKTVNKDDFTKSYVRLSTMDYQLGWAGSAITLSNESIQLLDLQEVDKYKESPNKAEAGTIELAETRVINYPNSYKIFITSTPTTEAGPVWQALTVECEVIFDYYVRCPYCGQEQYMTFERIRWPKGADGHSLNYQDIFRDKLAWYECEECEAHWSDIDRDQAVKTRLWRARTQDGSPGLEAMQYVERHRTTYPGFHQPSWISTSVSLSRVAADWLKIQDPRRDYAGKRKARKNFYNKHKAEAWLEIEESRGHQGILDLCDQYPKGVVPGNDQTAALVAGVDTQDDGFWYLILAVGYGLSPTCWVIDAGFVLSFADLHQVLWEDVYRDANNNLYTVQFCLQDCLGHRTHEVYDFCVKYPGLMLPSVGRQTMEGPYGYSPVEFYPGTEKRKFPGQLMRVKCNSTFYKDKLDGKLRVSLDDPGSMRFYHGFPEDFAKMFCAEARDDSGFWQQLNNRPNHLWDAAYLSLVGVDIKGIQRWATPAEQKVVEQQREEQKAKKAKQIKQKRRRW